MTPIPNIKTLARMTVFAFFGLLFVYGCGPDAPSFDEERAFGYLVEQCDFGPRNPGSEGAAEAADYFESFFAERADSTYRQTFEFTDTILDTTYSCANIIAQFKPNHLPRLILCAHWDTRPMADRDPDTTLRNQPILGANDGASGCAILMEMSNLIPEMDTPYGIDVVLFDCEDYGASGHLDYFCVGSKHFVEDLQPSDYAFGVLVDLVGDSDLRIYREAYSHTYARRVVDEVWKVAAETGAESFVDSIKHAVYDDHIPFLQKGIPVIDIIDFDYAYWHTLADKPDKCSPSSLGEVGKVLVALLGR